MSPPCRSSSTASASPSDSIRPGSASTARNCWLCSATRPRKSRDWSSAASSASRKTRPLARNLPRRRRKRGQLADVPRIVLDDDRGPQVPGDVLDAIQRRDGLRPVEVEARHAVALVVLLEVRRVADQDEGSLL